MNDEALARLLALDRPTEVVDVGANPIDGEPPYRAMLAAGQCRVTGFEPQPDALRALRRRRGTRERYFPWAVGDGRTHTLHVCAAPGMTSLLEPDPAALALFDLLRPMAQVVARVAVQTRRLDDMEEVEHLDFLKIDAQGSELAVLRAGAVRLAQAVAVQTEVSFVPIYQGQASIGEIDLELRRQGFLPHCLAELKHWPLAPCVVNGDPCQPLRQLLEADLVYVRDITRPDAMSDAQLKHLAMLAHWCFRSFDLALRCVLLLEQRGALAEGTQARYLRLAARAALPPAAD
jgi:FkbM family methyltransferase